MVKELYAKEQKDSAGQRDVGIFARKMDAADILARGHRLVRSYNLDREDMNRMVRDRVSKYVNGLQSASMTINAAAGATIEKGGATDKQKRLAESAQAKRIGYMRDLIEIARAAKDVAPDWFSAPAMVNVLTKSGISSTDARLVIIGSHGDLPDQTLRKAPQPTVDILDTEAYQKVFGRDS
jgi:predicted transcriptional regulator of viral defense system